MTFKPNPEEKTAATNSCTNKRIVYIRKSSCFMTTLGRD